MKVITSKEIEQQGMMKVNYDVSKSEREFQKLLMKNNVSRHRINELLVRAQNNAEKVSKHYDKVKEK